MSGKTREEASFFLIPYIWKLTVKCPADSPDLENVTHLPYSIAG